MDIAAASTGAASSSVATSINISLLRAQDNLASAVAAELSASIGLGASIDAYA